MSFFNSRHAQLIERAKITPSKHASCIDCFILEGDDPDEPAMTSGAMTHAQMHTLHAADLQGLDAGDCLQHQLHAGDLLCHQSWLW